MKVLILGVNGFIGNGLDPSHRHPPPNWHV